MSDYLYRIQVKRSGRFWETKYAVPNRNQAEILYLGINIGEGWQKRLMYLDKCLAQVSA
jgi:hypothetical protein